jgi:hypothetical protein
MNQTRNTNSVTLYKQSEGQYSVSLNLRVSEVEAVQNAAKKAVRNSIAKLPKGNGNEWVQWMVQSQTKPRLTIILYKTRKEGLYTLWANFEATIKW